MKNNEAWGVLQDEIFLCCDLNKRLANILVLQNNYIVQMIPLFPTDLHLYETE
jgi:hypothetical protein